MCEAVHENGDVAVAFLKETARSTHTDVPFEASTAIVFRVRDGHVVELRGYMDRAKALAAAGLGG